MNDVEILRTNLAAIRGDRTLEAFADDIGLKAGYVSELLNGKRTDFRLSTLIRVCKKLGISISQLFDPETVPGTLLDCTRYTTENDDG